MSTGIQKKEKLALPPVIIKAFDLVLSEHLPEDLAFAALLLTLPSEEYLAEQMAVIDVEAIHRAREFMRRELADALADKFQALYERLRPETPYRYEARPGRRPANEEPLPLLYSRQGNRAGCRPLPGTVCQG